MKMCELVTDTSHSGRGLLAILPDVFQVGTELVEELENALIHFSRPTGIDSIPNESVLGFRPPISAQNPGKGNGFLDGHGNKYVRYHCITPIGSYMGRMC